MEDLEQVFNDLSKDQQIWLAHSLVVLNSGGTGQDAVDAANACLAGFLYRFGADREEEG